MNEKNQGITICSVGDLMICDSPLYASVGVGSKYKTIRDKLFCNCNDIFNDADKPERNADALSGISC